MSCCGALPARGAHAPARGARHRLQRRRRARGAHPGTASRSRTSMPCRCRTARRSIIAASTSTSGAATTAPAASTSSRPAAAPTSAPGARTRCTATRTAAAAPPTVASEVERDRRALPARAAVVRGRRVHHQPPLAAQLRGASCAQRGLHLPFETITRADRLQNEAAAQALAELGCYRIWIGSESGSQRSSMPCSAT